MKRFTPFIALLALVALAGCSGDSPSAKPVPTVVPDAWSITSLTASSSAPFVGTVILVEAVVTRNGSPAPDDTSVAFTASGGAFANGTTQASVLTSGGTASAVFLADTAGAYGIQAQVGGASRQLTVEYRDRDVTEALQLYGIDPRRGSYAGGEQAVITGKGIQAPAEVFFDLGGVAYQGIVSGVSESNPLSEDGSITVVTPAFTGANNSIQQTADVRVITNAGTGSAETATLVSAFVLLPGGGPAIFGVAPSSGRSSGGEVVNILGQNFGSVASDLSVSFTDDDSVVRLATVLSVAPDGSQIQVETPRFSTLPLTEDRPQDVTVSTVDGGTTLEDSFVVLADNPQPEIASISPTAGPLDGGTLVTIFGSGFQAPMQVFFGNLTALDVNVFNDTTPANQDRITCVSPDYSTQGDVPPVVVPVRVVNSTSGLDSVYDAFTYGDNLYISGNSPQEGGLGDLVIIYGSGFEDPLQVFFGGNQMEVISVSGTEIVVRIPDTLGTECNPTSGDFRVVLLESNLEATGGSFTILGNSPQVLSVSPVIIPESDLGTPAADITINGRFFATDVLVRVGNYIAPSSTVTVNSATSIDVDNLPGIDELGVSFDPTPCILPGGQPGVRSASTPVAVTVTNFPGSCEDTLEGAIVIEPSSTVCTATPANLTTNPSGSWNFPNTLATTCSPSQTLTISNNGGESATLVNPALQTGTEFVYQTDDCPGTLAFGASCSFVVQFCPTTTGAKTDQVVISYQSASEGAKSVSVTLSGNGS